MASAHVAEKQIQIPYLAELCFGSALMSHLLYLGYWVMQYEFCAERAQFSFIELYG